MLLPQTLDALYQYQVEGVDWLGRRRSGLLADEPGLGKSLQVIVNFANLRKHNPDARCLVVAPNNVIYKWAEVEWGKWTSFSVDVASGTKLERASAIKSRPDVTVIAYDNLNRELANLNDARYHQILFDESHNIKNPTAKRTEAAFGLRGVQRFLITGSPMLNRVDELWSQLFMIDPVAWGTYWGFVNRYAVYGGYEGRQIIGVQNARELRDRMAPYMLRRLVSEVGKQIPPRTNIPVYVDLLPNQRSAYNAAREDLKANIHGEIQDLDNPLTMFMRLRQICNTMASIGGPDESAKLDRAVELVQQIGPDHKIVIFSGDIAALHCMRERLKRINIDAPIIAGKVDGKVMDARKREVVVQDFQSASPEPRVLLASHGVAREGIDLYRASYGITLDKMWVPELQNQEYRRLQRTGQAANHVTFYDLMCKDTVESRVEKLLTSKQKTFDQIIEESTVKSLLVANMDMLLANK